VQDGPDEPRGRGEAERQGPLAGVEVGRSTVSGPAFDAARGRSPDVVSTGQVCGYLPAGWSSDRRRPSWSWLCCSTSPTSSAASCSASRGSSPRTA